MNKNVTIKYKGFSVEICSYQLLASKKWRPKVILQEDRQNEVIETPLLWDKELETKKEADKFAMAQSKMFIDRKSI